MREMTTSDENGLISTVIAAVLTLAIGTGLSLLLGGFVKGFLTLAVVALAAFLVVYFRNTGAGSPFWTSPRKR